MKNQPSILAVDPTITLTRGQVEAVVTAYAEAMSNADADALAELFTHDAIRQDPVGGTPDHGREEIRDAFSRVFSATTGTIHFQPGPVRGAGNVYAFTFSHTVQNDAGSQTLNGIDVFALTAGGLIGAAAAYWGPDDRE